MNILSVPLFDKTDTLCIGRDIREKIEETWQIVVSAFRANNYSSAVALTIDRILIPFYDSLKRENVVIPSGIKKEIECLIHTYKTRENGLNSSVKLDKQATTKLIDDVVRIVRVYGCVL